MLERWNAALDHIENNLDREIDAGELARITLTSEYHFRRVFSALAGLPLSHYIRQRRMTSAAADILDGTAVLDVATKYGYTADAFTRPSETYTASRHLRPADPEPSFVPDKP